MTALDQLVRLHRWTLDEKRQKLAELERFRSKLLDNIGALEAELAREQATAERSTIASFSLPAFIKATIDRRRKIEGSIVEQKVREKEAQADDLPRVRLQTNKGEIVVELFENEAPETVGNFISLVEKGYYNGLSFHRVLDPSRHEFTAEVSYEQEHENESEFYRQTDFATAAAEQQLYRSGCATTGVTPPGTTTFTVTAARQSNCQGNGESSRKAAIPVIEL